MAKEEEALLSLGDAGEITVDGWDGLERWLERERAQWEWLVRGDGQTDAHNWATTVQGHWDNMMNAVRTVRAQGHEIGQVLPHLKQLVRGQLVTSTGPDGALILDIRASAGDNSASFAYAFLKGAATAGNARNREELLGAILTVIPDVREPTQLSARLKRERDNYRSGIRSALERIDRENNERIEGVINTVGRGKEIGSRLVRRRRDRWHSAQTDWQGRADAAVDSIKAVEAAYLESMRLQAPVKYWTDKAVAHGKKEWWAIARLAVFFPVALGALGVIFWKSATYLLAHASTPGAETPLALYVIITGGLAVVSSILFWIGRLLTKLYLSEHHLKNDASERAIMTQTYLALTKEAAASDADRSIILNALFRNTPDGIVKEDGPVDPSMQAVLARLVMR